MKTGNTTCCQVCGATITLIHCCWECRTVLCKTVFQFLIQLNFEGISLVAQSVKNLPAMQETQVRSLGQEDPLEKGMAVHFSIPPWRIPWTEEPGRLQSMGLQESDMTEQENHHHVTFHQLYGGSYY